MFKHYRVFDKLIVAVLVLFLSGCEKYAMQGTIVDDNNRGIAEVPIEVDGVAKNGKVVQGTITTDENGDFNSKIPQGFTGTLTPVLSAAFAQVAPTSRNYTNVQADQADQDFVATRIRFVLSGKVCDGGGNGIAGAEVAAVGNDGDGNAFNVNAITDANGDYVVMVPWGWVGTTTPSMVGYTFETKACSVP